MGKVRVTSKCSKCGVKIETTISEESAPYLQDADVAVCKNCDSKSNWRPISGTTRRKSKNT